MPRPLAAALALGTVNFALFWALSAALLWPGLLVVGAAPVALWVACVAAAHLVLASTPFERLDAEAGKRLVGRGALAGAVLGGLAAAAILWRDEPGDALLAGVFLGAPLGALAGAACALADVALLLAWRRARRRAG